MASNKKSEQKAEARKPKIEKRTVECVLTEQEKLAYSKELGEIITKKSRSEDAIKSFNQQAKAEIASFDARLYSLADKVNTGKEYRDVPCEIVFDFKKKEKYWVRQDTGETCYTADITESELQEEINL